MLRLIGHGHLEIKLSKLSRYVKIMYEIKTFLPMKARLLIYPALLIVMGIYFQIVY